MKKVGLNELLMELKSDEKFSVRDSINGDFDFPIGSRKKKLC